MTLRNLTDAEKIVSKLSETPAFIKSSQIYSSIWYECAVCGFTTARMGELHVLENHANWCLVRQAREYMAAIEGER